MLHEKHYFIIIWQDQDNCGSTGKNRSYFSQRNTGLSQICYFLIKKLLGLSGKIWFLDLLYER